LLPQLATFSLSQHVLAPKQGNSGVVGQFEIR
jgi:hypothetical protein